MGRSKRPSRSRRRSTEMRNPTTIVPLLSASVAAVMLVVTLQSPAQAASAAPQAVLRDHLHALYSRDTGRAYDLLARADREEKSLADYRAESAPFDGPALLLARTLADAIRFHDLRVEMEGDRATVTFEAVIPDANAAAIDELVLGFADDRLAALSPSALDARQETLRRMAAQDRLPTLRATETWELVREADGWRVFLNWAEAIEVRFEAVTLHDLGWHFEPRRDRVMARYGETIEMAYRARNIGTRETTGKARHIVGPAVDAGFMEIISCFCFLEQTLAPGEAVELPLVFRIDFDAPETVKRFDVRYEFYPADRFPSRHPAGAAAG